MNQESNDALVSKPKEQPQRLPYEAWLSRMVALVVKQAVESIHRSQQLIDPEQTLSPTDK